MIWLMALIYNKILESCVGGGTMIIDETPVVVIGYF